MYFSNFYRFLHNYCILFSVKLQLILQFLFSNIYQSGAYYIGDYKDGSWHGKGEYHYSTGSVYNGQWENGKWNGYGTKTYSDGTKKTGKWKDDKFLG